jgi:hypothetical protein
VGRVVRWRTKGMKGKRQVRARLEGASVCEMSYAWAAFCFLE